jgi:hypothetical protein
MFMARGSVVVVDFFGFFPFSLQRSVSILCWNSDPTACCGAVTGLLVISY